MTSATTRASRTAVSCSVTDSQTDRQTDLLDEVEDGGKSLVSYAARLVDCKHKVDDVAAA